jgi:hypothetical protein
LTQNKPASNAEAGSEERGRSSAAPAIAYDGAPVVNANGVTENPENCDKLAQRNLQVTKSNNPGSPETRIIPQTFDLRPSLPPILGQDALLHYPDELMIDWGNTPAGSKASIYWPQVSALQVLQLASRLYASHLLTATDANTIQCEVTKSTSYVPIPTGAGQNFAGLLTIELPPNVVKGQEFNVVVRRITTRRFQEEPPIQIGFRPKPARSKRQQDNVLNSKRAINWRYVVGTFQVKIPVSTAHALLPAEENTLAIFKWRLQAMSPKNRWYPVLERYISYIAARVDGLGGDSTAIKPSLQGVPAKGKDSGEGGKGQGEERIEYNGKVSGLIYDRFGDFDGFILDTEDGERRFWGRETEIEIVVRRAWAERIVTTVFVERDESHRPQSVVLHAPPPPFRC